MDFLVSIFFRTAGNYESFSVVSSTQRELFPNWVIGIGLGIGPSARGRSAYFQLAKHSTRFPAEYPVQLQRHVYLSMRKLVNHCDTQFTVRDTRLLCAYIAFSAYITSRYLEDLVSCSRRSLFVKVVWCGERTLPRILFLVDPKKLYYV